MDTLLRLSHGIDAVSRFFGKFIIWLVLAAALITESKTDVSEGRFLSLVPGERIVWSVVFSSHDPAFAREMRMTWRFDRVPEGTEVSIVAEDAPSGITAEDHAEGLRASLENLARFVTT